MPSLSCGLLAAYVIIKLSAYSIQDSISKILMNYGKIHMTHDMTFLLSTGRSECQRYSHRLTIAHA